MCGPKHYFFGIVKVCLQTTNTCNALVKHNRHTVTTFLFCYKAPETCTKTFASVLYGASKVKYLSIFNIYQANANVSLSIHYILAVSSSNVLLIVLDLQNISCFLRLVGDNTSKNNQSEQLLSTTMT